MMDLVCGGSGTKFGPALLEAKTMFLPLAQQDVEQSLALKSPKGLEGPSRTLRAFRATYDPLHCAQGPQPHVYYWGWHPPQYAYVAP